MIANRPARRGATMRASFRPARPRKAARTGPSRGEPGRPNGRQRLLLYRAYTERMAELIRSDALGHRDGFLAGLLDQWEQAKDWRTLWGGGPTRCRRGPGTADHGEPAHRRSLLPGRFVGASAGDLRDDPRRSARRSGRLRMDPQRARRLAPVPPLPSPGRGVLDHQPAGPAQARHEANPRSLLSGPTAPPRKDPIGCTRTEWRPTSAAPHPGGFRPSSGARGRPPTSIAAWSSRSRPAGRTGRRSIRS